MSTVPYPIQLGSDGAVERSRVTVFFRFLLVIPHHVVLWFYGIAVVVVLVVSWFAALILGRVPEGMHGFMAGYLRYSTRVSAYSLYLADPYPPFGSGGAYAVDLEIAPAERQGRVGVFFRTLLAYPCYLMSFAMAFVLFAVYVAIWWVAMCTGRTSAGLQSCGLYCLRFTARVNAYSFLLTSRYPQLGDTVPASPAPSRAPQGSLPHDQSSLPPIP
jgi:hypothetical protein